MSKWLDTLRRELRVGRALPPREPVSSEPDWKQANPRWIDRALRSALARPGGGWYVVDGARAIGSSPSGYRILGRSLVAYRCGDGRAIVAPGVCPHMGAPLEGACLKDDRVVCPWHGLELGPAGHGRWRPLPTHDDGVLVWVRIGEHETPSEAPHLPERPSRFIDAVARTEASCLPQDVIANRLDPWHGAHFHPHSFRTLQVIDQGEDSIVVRVTHRIAGPIGMEVDARFHCTDPRTIVMTIVDGDGEGSVVETHATPIDEGRTAIVEATLATSDRAGFPIALRLSRLIRPLMERAARRLWVEDAAYAEQLHRLRLEEGHAPSSGARADAASPRLSIGSR